MFVSVGMSAGALHANGQGGYAPRPRGNSLALVPLAQSPCAYLHTRIHAYTHAHVCNASQILTNQIRRT